MKSHFLEYDKLGNYLSEINLKKIIATCGTPFYLYSGEMVLERYNCIRNFIRWNSIKVFYAMKSNYNCELLKILERAGCGIDAVSPAEVHLAMKCGFSPERIIFTSSNNTDCEVDEVAETGVLLNIDSLSRLEKYGRKYPGTDICMRFNTDVVAGEHPSIQTGGSETKFGIHLSDAGSVVEICKQFGLKVKGLHKHLGSGISDVSKYITSMKNLLSVAEPGNFPDLEFIDIGGGFKVKYYPEEQNFDYSELGGMIGELFSGFCKRYGKKLYLYIEPGKFLVSEAGVFVVQVNTLKNNNGRLIAGVDSGFTHFIRPVLYEAYHHIFNISNPLGDFKKYDVCGNICESGDRFAIDRDIAEIREGDFLVLMNAGAYCFSMASLYNLRPLPKEIFIHEGNLSVSGNLLNMELADMIIRNYQN